MFNQEEPVSVGGQGRTQGFLRGSLEKACRKGGRFRCRCREIEETCGWPEPAEGQEMRCGHLKAAAVQHRDRTGLNVTKPFTQMVNFTLCEFHRNNIYKEEKGKMLTQRPEG